MLHIARAEVTVQPRLNKDTKQPMVSEQGEKLINYSAEGILFFHDSTIRPISQSGEYELLLKHIKSKKTGNWSYVCSFWKNLMTGLSSANT